MAIEILTNILTVCSVIISISTIVNVGLAVAARVKKPNEEQNKRLAALEEDVKEIKSKLNSDYTRITEIESGNKAEQRAILALLRHAINGDDINGMKEAQAELESYLINAKARITL